MKLNPNFSYEFNYILNEDFNETQNLQNFASIISDKDRFLQLLPLLEQNKGFIEERLGFKLPDEVEFYIVRAEKFKSFSLPVTIEYSILPEEMLLFLLKEILKVSILARFPDEQTREHYVNGFIDYFVINVDTGALDFVKFGKNLHDESLRMYSDYKYEDIDFSKKTMREYIEDMYAQ